LSVDFERCADPATSQFRRRHPGDGVGQSFIRSYVTLTRQTDESDVVLSYVGVTTSV